MRVVHVNLAFERAPDLANLLARYRTLTGLCGAQAATGDVEVHALQRFWRDEDLDAAGVSYHARVDPSAAPRPGAFTRSPSLWRLARDLRPDVVHFDGLIYPVQLADLRRAIGQTAVLVVQDHHNRPGHPLHQLVQRLVFPTADAFFFTAEGLASPWRGRGILRQRDRVFEVVEGSTRFRRQPSDLARASTGVHGHPAVLWVGRLRAVKDPLTAVAGFAQACARLPEARLFMVYQDDELLPEIEALRRRAPELGARIHLAGAVPHEGLESWYSAADLFLTASPDEGCNYALVEAMACGLPAVCSDNPVHVRLTGGGSTGELFPVGSVDGCATAIVAAAGRVGTNGEAWRAQVRARFDAVASWPAIAKASLAAYRLLLERRRSTGVPSSRAVDRAR